MTQVLYQMIVFRNGTLSINTNSLTHYIKSRKPRKKHDRPYGNKDRYRTGYSRMRYPNEQKYFDYIDNQIWYANSEASVNKEFNIGDGDLYISMANNRLVSCSYTDNVRMPRNYINKTSKRKSLLKNYHFVIYSKGRIKRLHGNLRKMLFYFRNNLCYLLHNHRHSSYAIFSDECEKYFEFRDKFDSLQQERIHKISSQR